MKYYTGLSLDNIPLQHVAILHLIGEALKPDFFLRSGDGNSGEASLREGCESQGEIFIPHKGFNESPSRFSLENIMQEKIDACKEIVLKVAPDVEQYHNSDRHYITAFQLLGLELDEPSKFLLVDAPKSLMTDDSHVSTAIKLAEYCSIPVFNIAKKEHFERMKTKVEENHKEGIYMEIRKLLWEWVNNGSPRGIQPVSIDDAKEAMSKLSHLKPEQATL